MYVCMCVYIYIYVFMMIIIIAIIIVIIIISSSGVITGLAEAPGHHRPAVEVRVAPVRRGQP